MQGILGQLEQDKGKSELDRFEYTQMVYNLAFLELSKQVSMQCNERGSLISTLWKAFLSLLNSQMKHIRTEKGILERESVTSLERFHKYYEKMMEDYRANMLKMFKDS